MTPDRLRLLISGVLLVGVGVGAALVTAGLIGSFTVGWGGSLLGAVPDPGPITKFEGIAAGIADLRPVAIAQLGLLVIVATPIVRVAASLAWFAADSDALYVAISAVVLAILLSAALLLR